MRLLLTAVLTMAATWAHAAQITADHFLFGGTRILYRGQTEMNDAEKFRAVASRIPRGETVVVVLAGPGGFTPPAMEIGQMIRQRRWSTMVWSSRMCASACVMMWLAGEHAVIQAGSRLGIHGPADSRTGRPVVDGEEDDYFRHLGLTESEIRFMNTPKQPAIHWANLRDLFKLMVLAFPVPSWFGIWRLCPTRICVAVP